MDSVGCHLCSTADGAWERKLMKGLPNPREKLWDPHWLKFSLNQGEVEERCQISSSPGERVHC